MSKDRLLRVIYPFRPSIYTSCKCKITKLEICLPCVCSIPLIATTGEQLQIRKGQIIFLGEGQGCGRGCTMGYTAYNVKSTAYKGKSTAYNVKSTACKEESTAYNAKSYNVTKDSYGIPYICTLVSINRTDT